MTRVTNMYRKTYEEATPWQSRPIPSPAPRSAHTRKDSNSNRNSRNYNNNNSNYNNNRARNHNYENRNAKHQSATTSAERASFKTNGYAARMEIKNAIGGKTCFNCREVGHTVSRCPKLKAGGGGDGQITGSKEVAQLTGICYKCGSKDHKASKCQSSQGMQFALCFICQQQGHISSQCPNNDKGLYPNGGGCKICGSVKHYAKDCDAKKKRYRDKDENGADEGIPAVMNESNADTDDILDQLAYQDGKKKKRLKSTTTAVTTTTSSTPSAAVATRQQKKSAPKVVKF